MVHNKVIMTDTNLLSRRQFKMLSLHSIFYKILNTKLILIISVDEHIPISSIFFKPLARIFENTESLVDIQFMGLFC